MRDCFFLQSNISEPKNMNRQATNTEQPNKTNKQKKDTQKTPQANKLLALNEIKSFFREK